MDNANTETKTPSLLTALTDLLDECLQAGHGSDKDYQWPTRIAAAQAAIAAATKGPIPASVSDEELRKDAQKAHDLLSEMCYNHDDQATLSELAQRVANIVAVSTGVTYLASGPVPTAPMPAPAVAHS